MKRLLYPLIASALITIVPFLLTFEKGQDIVRGLFGYEYFALLLLIIFIKSKLTNSSLRGFLQMPKQTLVKFLATAILLALAIITLFIVANLDLQNLLAIKNWEANWYGIIPFITCALAIAMVWQLKPFKFNTICFILFIALTLHLEANNRYAAQPLAQFPTIDYLERTTPKPAQRSEITKEFHQKYTVSDSVTITRDFVDTTRNNVIILVESWGVPLNIQRFEKQLEIFEGIATVGIHNRMYSRTRTAEREDLIETVVRDSITKLKDTLFLPNVFNELGHQATFLFGGDSLEHYRFKYIKNIGFGESIYGNGLNDQAMVSKIDSILTDSTQNHFMAWTTTDTKFPMEEFADIYNSNADSINSTYTTKLKNTFAQIAGLVHKFPKTRFIIQGDHNPILSPTEFQNKFYKRWVPYIILN
jgi:hypothetical protein